jgi:thiol-disulfide isomerase/thioredoxin
VTAGLAACLAALAVATATGFLWKARDGRMRQPAPRPRRDAQRVTAAAIGQPLGERATLLQFSSAFCAPCRATRVILADVARRAEGIAHVEIDAESHLDLVRELGVLRTPTVLVLAPDGAIAVRASGQPRRADVLGALDLVTAGSYSSGLESR